jgi:hypothetical protein
VDGEEGEEEEKDGFHGKWMDKTDAEMVGG